MQILLGLPDSPLNTTLRACTTARGRLMLALGPDLEETALPALWREQAHSAMGATSASFSTMPSPRRSNSIAGVRWCRRAVHTYCRLGSGDPLSPRDALGDAASYQDGIAQSCTAAHACATKRILVGAHPRNDLLLPMLFGW